MRVRANEEPIVTKTTMGVKGIVLATFMTIIYFKSCSYENSAEPDDSLETGNASSAGALCNDGCMRLTLSEGPIAPRLARLDQVR